MKDRMRAILGALASIGILTFAAVGPASAFTPQTIVVDGSNDFLPANLVENDSSDTQFSQLDMGRVYMTNDANKLYIGYVHDRGTWNSPAVQVGMAISTLGKNGATGDMWGRKIAFNTATHKPGYGAYVNYNNNWQGFSTWTGTAWSSLRAGPGVNGMGHTLSGGAVVGTFHEIPFLLCELGLAAGDSIWVEMWVTQDSPSKGPLDALVNDAAQLSKSNPPGTTWDVTTAVELPLTFGYRIMSTGDAIQPTVTSAGKRQPFTLSVVYSEPVELSSAQNTTNYALGGTTAIVVDAVRRTTPCNIVDLTLSSNIGPKNGLYSVTVTNVRDMAGNTILNNGTTNKAEFALKKLTFRGLFGLYLQSHSSPPNTFYVKGDVAPLDFDAGCVQGLMANTGVDSIFRAVAEFSVDKQPGATYADTTLHWKFNHKCTTYEPLATNRSFLVTSRLGAEDTLTAYWNDQDPTQFLSHPIDAIFRVDMTGVGVPTDTITVNGTLLPLNWNVPSVTRLLDDGVAPDAVAGDRIYSKRVRFATGSLKTLGFKYLRNRTYECADSIPVWQGDRSAFLNDAAYDTTGGTLGPLTLPVGKYNYCTITNKPVKTVWHLKVDPSSWPQGPGTHDVGVRGSAAPLSWGSDLLLRDNGTPPDNVAGDKIYSGEGTFPLGTNLNIEWKYAVGGVFESRYNRGLYLNDVLFSDTNPIVLNDTLSVVTDVTPGVVARKLVLRQNEPNPFNPATRVDFVVPRDGRYRLAVYDALGRRVRLLLDAELPAGPGSTRWDGLTERGERAGSGVYLYALEDANGGGRVSRKMILLK